MPMATPLAVPVVDLPVVWWPWRPRHHHYYCIISFRVFMFLVPLIRRKSVLLLADIKKPIRTIATETWILDPQCTTESESLIEVCIIYIHIYIFTLYYISVQLIRASPKCLPKTGDTDRVLPRPSDEIIGDIHLRCWFTLEDIHHQELLSGTANFLRVCPTETCKYDQTCMLGMRL